jgi:hypothetical protein
MDIPVIIVIANTGTDMSLHVYYGFTKLKPSIKKIEMVCVFENDDHNRVKLDEFVAKMMHVVHTRYQNEGEKEDAHLTSRTFTKYGYFVDEPPWRGDIERCLRENFNADENNVSLEERELIRQKLRELYYKIFNRKPLRQLQLEL